MSTMKRVAERAGVSIATVSRVVNKSSFVAPSLQKVVMEAMEALRYQPSAVARGLRTRETRSIGVLVPQLSQPFFSSLAYAIERTLFSHGYRAFLCSAEEDAAEESAYIDMLLSQRVDGLILVFLQSSRPPTAVMALNDVIAVGALHAAWKAGLSLPRDLSVTGFDDISLARYTMPELTTAAQPVFEMGRKAALRLLLRIQKPDLKVRRTLLPISLVIRGSTAPPN